MKLCWHDWKVWDTIINIKKNIIYLFIFLIITLLFIIAGFKILYCLYAIITVGVATNIAFMHDTNDSMFKTFLYEDKTCIKCMRHKFNASIIEKKIKQEIIKANKKEMTAKEKAKERETIINEEIRPSFEKSRGLFIKAL